MLQMPEGICKSVSAYAETGFLGHEQVWILQLTENGLKEVIEQPDEKCKML